MAAKKKAAKKKVAKKVAKRAPAARRATPVVSDPYDDFDAGFEMYDEDYEPEFNEPELDSAYLLVDLDEAIDDIRGEVDELSAYVEDRFARIKEKLVNY